MAGRGEEGHRKIASPGSPDRPCLPRRDYNDELTPRNGSVRPTRNLGDSSLTHTRNP